MAISAYLMIDGRPGPSKSKENAIEILSFSFGAVMPVSYQTGSSGSESRHGRASLQDVSITKMSDKTSPLLFDDCVTANNFVKVEIILDKMTGDKAESFFKITMEDALISSFQVGGGGENSTESVSFAFEKVKVSYNQETDEGGLQGWVEKGFDVSKLVTW